MNASHVLTALHRRTHNSAAPERSRDTGGRTRRGWTADRNVRRKTPPLADRWTTDGRRETRDNDRSRSTDTERKTEQRTAQRTGARTGAAHGRAQGQAQRTGGAGRQTSGRRAVAATAGVWSPTTSGRVTQRQDKMAGKWPGLTDPGGGRGRAGPGRAGGIPAVAYIARHTLTLQTD